MDLSADPLLPARRPALGRALEVVRRGAVHQHRGTGREGRRRSTYVLAGLRLAGQGCISARSSPGSSGCAPGRWSRSTSVRRLRRLRRSSSTWCISRSRTPPLRPGALMLTMVAPPTRCLTVRRSGRRSTARTAPAAEPRASPVAMGGAVNCEVCHFLYPLPHGGHAMRPLRRPPASRKPNSIGRAWALMVAGGHPLRAGQYLSRPDRDPTRLRRAQHHHGRRRANCCRAGCIRSPPWCSAPASWCPC